LRETFHFLDLDPESGTLSVCGGKNVAHNPERLKGILNTLASLLGESGRGSILLTCEQTEICYFRRNMWKLMRVYIPEDPFEDIHYLAGGQAR
jgi:hypothetical protein